MPPARISTRTRRRSSLVPITPAKAGTYSVPARPISFAPNITPVSYTDPASDDDTPPSPTSHIFPPSSSPAPPPARKRQPPGKRRSQGYIPRPPNAFMLFRADFVRQKHVPGSIETNHGSLSKIIGNCWHKLPPEQKKIWDKRAKEAKAEHKLLYPNYRFKPVHNKNKYKKEKAESSFEEERRCEEVAQLLLEGKKGAELARAVRDLERSATPQAPQQQYHLLRRPSSVPLPSEYGNFNIALPSVPFLQPQPQAQQQAQYLRRPSSAFDSSAYNPYTFSFRKHSGPSSAFNNFIPIDHAPLPEANTSLFEPGFFTGFGSSQSVSQSPFDSHGPMDPPAPYTTVFNTMSDLIPPLSHPTEISPLAQASPYTPEYTTPGTLVDAESPWDPRMVDVSMGGSAGSTAYDGSPEPTEVAPTVLAPVPVTPTPVGAFEGGWGFAQEQEQGQQCAPYQAEYQPQPELFDYTQGGFDPQVGYDWSLNQGFGEFVQDVHG